MATDDVEILIQARNRSNAAFDQAIRNLGGLQAGAVTAGGAVKGMTRDLLAFGAKAILPLIAFREAMGLIKASLDEFQEGIQATTRLNAALTATGNTTGFTAAGLGKIADELDRLSVFEDDKIVEAQASLAAFDKVAGDVFKRSMRMGADLAHNFGGDLITNVENLGAVLQTPDQGMRRLGIAARLFSEADNELIKSLLESNKLLEAQDFILTRLESKFGGSAGKLDDYTKSVTELSKAWDRVKESSGEVLSKPTTPAFNWLADMLNKVSVGQDTASTVGIGNAAEAAWVKTQLEWKKAQRVFAFGGNANPMLEKEISGLEQRLSKIVGEATSRLISRNTADTVLTMEAASAKVLGDFQGRAGAILNNEVGKLAADGFKAGDKWGSFDSGKVAKTAFSSPRFASLAATESRFLTRGRGGASPEVDAIIKHVGKPVNALAKAVGKQGEELKRVVQVLERIEGKAPTVEINDMGK